jgi:RimJ/RimL family protein N-acetyltransferase
MPPILADTARGDGFGRWAVIEKSTGDFIGWIHFRRSVDTPTEIELGYRLIRSAWGKGYATEGSKALIEKGLREQRVTHISATALADNAASIRVMEKCGLTFEHDYKYGDADAVKYAWRATTDVVSGRRGAAPA